MARTPPPPVTPFSGEAPVRHQRATFSLRIDAFVTWLYTGVGEVVAVVTNCYENAVDAYQSAVAAAQSAASAAEQADLAATNGAEQVALATAQVNLAIAQAGVAAMSAASAVNAPGTSATSTTSMTIDETAQSLIIQAGKDFVIGQFVVLSVTSDPINYMVGQITDYNSSTGAMAVRITHADGSGTHANWSVALGPLPVKNNINSKIFFNGAV